MSHVLIVDDEPGICWALRRLVEAEGHDASVAASAEEALELAAQQAPDLVLLDVRLPNMDGLTAMGRMRPLLGDVPVVVITAFGTLDVAVKAFEGGAFDYLIKPFHLDQVATVVRRALAHEQRRDTTRYVAWQDPTGDGFVGTSLPMQEIYKRIALVAPTRAGVLITGESGTGKELVARSIHRHSRLADQPLVPVNLASLSPALIESELFGHVRGAFTGADQARKGLLELASGGSVFLDEVADIPLAVQVKLLRVLEQQEILRVGDSRPRRAVFRLIAATHRDLLGEVRAGRFREDLYFRLAVFQIHLPPLRERRGDIAQLAGHFLRRVQEVGDAALSFSEGALEELGRRHWPGNVRQLRNAVEHAALVARWGEILPGHLPADLEGDAAGGAVRAEPLAAAVRQWAGARLRSTEGVTELYQEFLNAAEPALLDEALNATSQNRAAAAHLLGLHRATLRKKLS